MRLRLDTHDKPGLSSRYAQSASLSYGEILYPLMLAHNRTIKFNDIAWISTDSLLQKGFLISGRDKTDILAVGFGRYQQTRIFSHLANFALGIGTHWHQGAPQLLLAHTE